MPAAAGARGRFKRLTLFESLHIRIKTQASRKGTKMADEIRALQEEGFPSGDPVQLMRVIG